MVRANTALRHLPVLFHCQRNPRVISIGGVIPSLVLGAQNTRRLQRPHSPKSAIRIVHAFRRVKLVFFVPFQAPGSCNLVCSYAPFPSSFGPRNPSAGFLSTCDLVRWNSGIISKLPCHNPPANGLEPCNGRWCRSHRHTYCSRSSGTDQAQNLHTVPLKLP